MRANLNLHFRGYQHIFMCVDSHIRLSAICLTATISCFLTAGLEGLFAGTLICVTVCQRTTRILSASSEFPNKCVASVFICC